MDAVSSPVASPQSVGFHGSSMWVTSVKTQRIYEIDPSSLAVSREVVPPGEPFGFAFMGGDLYAVIGFNNDADDRFVYRQRNGTFEEVFPCPDLSGSFLVYDDARCYLTQANDKKLVTLDAKGNVLHTVEVARRPVGVTVANGSVYVVTADDDWKNRAFARIDPKSGSMETLAAFPFQARGLGYDGQRFWTTSREANELVSFSA